MNHNLQPFKPITYNLSSEKPIAKFAFQMQPAALHRVVPDPRRRRVHVPAKSSAHHPVIAAAESVRLVMCHLCHSKQSVN
jgi:hypothetical protein